MGWIELAMVVVGILYGAYASRQIRTKRLAFEDADFPTFEEGTPQYVVFGDCWSADWCVIAWGNQRAKKVYKGGWLNKHEAGYRYSATIQMGLGRGPINAITVITVGDKLAWSGTMSSGSLYIDKRNLFGGDEGNGGIVGTMQLLSGAADQLPPALLDQLLGGMATGCRGVVSALFDGQLCSMSKSPQPWKFRHWRTDAGWQRNEPWYPAKAIIMLSNELADLSDYPAAQHAELRKIRAMNGAHILVEVATNGAWGRRMDMSELDLTSYAAAADQLFAEGLGICLRYTRESSLSEFVQTVLDHISAGQFVSRKTGLLTLRLIRDDYDVADLPVFTYGSGLLSIEELDSSTDEAVNVVVANYKDPVLNQTRQVRARNVGAVQATGSMVSTTRDYQGIPTWETAQRLAERDLRVLTGGTRNFKVILDRRGWEIEPTGVFVVQAPEEGFDQLVLRAAKLDFGNLTDGKITITCAVDVFGLSSNRLTTEPDSGYVRPSNSAVAAPAQVAFELSRRDLALVLSPGDLDALADGAGLVGMAGKRPDSAATDFALVTRIGTADYASVGEAECTPYGRLQSAIGMADTVLVLVATSDLEDVQAGTAALLGNEIVRIDAIDASTCAVTVARGCVDTVPVAHAANTELWFYERAMGIDPAVRLSGATVNAKLLTRTSSDQLPVADAPGSSVTLFGRATRPYPPGLVRVAGESTPAAASGSFTVSWAHRDRLLQLDQLIDSEATSRGPEATTRYALRFFNALDEVIVEKLDIVGTAATVVLDHTGSTTMELYAISDNGESWQKHERNFTYTPPIGVVVSTITAGSYSPIETVIDGGEVTP